MSGVRRLAIGNRGEPAMRCLAAVAELGDDFGEPITTIALYTDPDAASLFVRQADEAVPLGAALITEPGGNRHGAYVDIDRVMTALAQARADSVWVGWGFVAESAEFAARCEAAGITFIGPPSDVIRLLGDKVRAKQLAERIGVPVVPWSGGSVHDAQSAQLAAGILGYPVLVKAAAGGGGRGIRLVESESAMPAAFASAQREAEAAFGDPTVFIERKLGVARHVEVQVIADGQGTVWAAGIRDCSIQRRNQKVIEESGSTKVSPATEAALRDAAVRLCDAVGYRSAGTVEFLVDPLTQQFMLMEINTRLQVEHPVTEMTTGVDLVKLQLLIARGGTLPPSPPPVAGYAIEARLNAEDPEHDFAPTPGRVSALRLPAGPGIRIDTGVAEGDNVAAEFDSMIAKIIARGHDRAEALSRLKRALAQSLVVIDGGTTNKAFLLSLAGHPDIRAGRYDNRWLDRLTEAGGHLPAADPISLLAAAVEAADADQAAVQANFLAAAARGRPEVPEEVGHRLRLRAHGGCYQMHVYCLGQGDYRVAADPAAAGSSPAGADPDDTSGPGDIPAGIALVDLNVQRLGCYERAITCCGRRYKIVAASQGPRLLIEVDGIPHVITRDDGGQVRCPSPAFVVAVLVAEGDIVRTGDPLAVVESMKMEATIAAPQDGVVSSVLAQMNTQVRAGAPLVALRASDQQTGSSGPDGEGAEFAGLAQPRDIHSEADIDHLLRAYLLGYDIEDGDARELSRERDGWLASVPPGDEGTLRSEQELLEIFTDAAALSRRVPEDDEEEEHRRSSHEHLLTYLSFLDPERSGIPGHFAQQLRTALARYGIQSLTRTPELEQALLRMTRSVGRMPAAAPIVVAILDRWRRCHDALAGAMTDDRLGVLARLIDSTQGRYSNVCDLARDVRFCYIDAPVINRTRATAYAEIETSLDELCGHPAAEQRRDLADRIVWFPLPMRARLRDRYRHADKTGRARLLEVRTRRYYRIRDLIRMRCETFGGHLTCLADYREPGQLGPPVHLVTAYVPIAGLPAFARAVAPYLTGLAADRPVVVDVESWRDEPLLADEDMAAELAQLLARTNFGRDVRRLSVIVTSATRGCEH